MFRLCSDMAVLNAASCLVLCKLVHTYGIWPVNVTFSFAYLKCIHAGALG